jgi:signal transduction histidine kinase/ligand-binding sensor domain-containing protein
MSVSTHHASKQAVTAAVIAGIILIIGCYGVRTAIAQHARPGLDPSVFLTQYHLDAWQVEDGLPQGSVYAVLQTRDGYLWAGTQEGLIRFDGVDFTVFDRRNLPGIESHWIRALLEDRRGRMWAATEGGGVFVMRGSELDLAIVHEELAGITVRALHEDAAGGVWMATLDYGLAHFAGGHITWYTTSEGLPHNDVLALAPADHGGMWVGTAGGLVHYGADGFTTWTASDGLPHDVVMSLLGSSKGDLWVGTVGGVARVTSDGIETPASNPEACPAPAAALWEDDRGTLWIGSLGAGLCRLRDDVIDVLDTGGGLTYDVVRALHQDREGNLWVGTDGGGLNKVSGTKFTVLTTAEGLSHDAVWTVLEDRSGAIWIGTDGGGLNRFENGSVRRFETIGGSSSDLVSALHEDSDGRLWAGTSDGKLCYLKGDRFECLTNDEGIAGSMVLTIREDRKGRLWVGTDGGLSLIRDDRAIPVAAGHVTGILEDRNGVLWIGTWGGGLQQLVSDELVPVHGVSIPDDKVLSMHEDEAGTLWVGTAAGGLCRVRNRLVRCLDTDDGLLSDKVIQVVDDEIGYLWLGSNKGIVRLRKDSLDAYWDGSQDQLDLTVFGMNDGLRSREMNGGTSPSAIKTRDGRLWFATMLGAASIHPETYQLNTIRPPAVVESFTANGQEVGVSGHIELMPGSRNLAFHFTALTFTSSADAAFMYRLEGYDDEWVEAGTRRHAYYTNLPPGDYTFLVRASNLDGVWSEDAAAVQFRLRPYFHQTPLFFVLCAVLILICILLLYRVRVANLRRRSIELQNLVDRQTHELRHRQEQLEQLNANLEDEVRRQIDVIMVERKRYEQELITARDRAEESARLKSTILNNMSHEIRTPITSILGYSEILAEEVGEEHQEFVDYINSNGKRLLSTLNGILDLSRFERDELEFDLRPTDVAAVVVRVAEQMSPAARRKGLSLDVRMDDAVRPAVADEAALDRILMNLLANAIKFTDTGEVVVSVGETDDGIAIEVRDTGIGIGEDFMPHLFEEFKQESSGLARSHEGSGLGLSITRRLVEGMDARIDVESEAGAGSVFTVVLKSAGAAHEVVA